MFGMKPRKSDERKTPSVLFITNNDDDPKCSTHSSIEQPHNNKKQRTTRKRSTVQPTAAKRQQSKRRSTKRKSSAIAHDHKPAAAAAAKPPIDDHLSMGTVITCDANHEGRLLLKANIQLAVDKLFEMLFTSKSTFLSEFHRMRNTTELQMGEWQAGQNGQRVRVVSMTIALQATFGPKSAKVIESHTMRACSAKGELYAIDVESVNEGIPHADVFTILMHYCLARSKENTTDILVFGNVNFIKSTWSVVKAFISKHSYEGMAEFFHSLNQALLKELEDKKKTAL